MPGSSQTGSRRRFRQDEYKAVRETLEKSPSVRECSDAVVKRFLRPADQSEAVLKKRAELGREFFRQFSRAEAEDPDGMPPEGTVTVRAVTGSCIVMETGTSAVTSPTWFTSASNALKPITK